MKEKDIIIPRETLEGWIKEEIKRKVNEYLDSRGLMAFVRDVAKTEVRNLMKERFTKSS